jgi:hypothetical protein
MIEKKVQIEILVPDFKMDLAAHKGKSYAQFQKERPEMLDQTARSPLPGFPVKTQEVKRVGSFKT